MGVCFHHNDRRLKTMTKSKMIVLWGSENILNSSIEYLLAPIANWIVVSISSTEDLEALILAAESKHRDIVIIHQERHNNPTNLSLQLLQDHPEIKVIVLSLEDNLMEIYSKQKKLVKQGSDLIAVIENQL